VANMETVPVDTERGHKGQEDNLEAGMVQGEVGEAAGLQQRTQDRRRREGIWIRCSKVQNSVDPEKV
jgi:hypothetical protein